MNSEERRLYVRETFSFSVTYRRLTSEEYHALNATGGQIHYPHKENEPGKSGADTGNARITPDAGVVSFLLQMDEKLDRIVTLLTQREAKENLVFREGKGVNVSGSGMNIITDEPVEPGQIIQTRFFLSRSPFVFMTVCGEVTWVTPVDENGRTLYQLGITFLDLNSSDRERIIACVFQRQREALRRRKSEGCDTKES